MLIAVDAGAVPALLRPLPLLIQPFAAFELVERLGSLMTSPVDQTL